MDALELIKTRRSTRGFKDVAVGSEKVKQILEAGRYAPSGGNSQTTHFFVIQNKQVLKDLADLAKAEFAKMETTPGMYKSLATSINLSKRGKYIFHYNAPVLIVTANKKDYGNNIADCACALENMMIMANALDLGSCWINQLKWLNENEVLLNYFRKLGLQDDERVYGAVAIGYPNTNDGFPVRTPLERTGNMVTEV